MSRRVAPVKLTGGRGFEFEDKAAAWYLVHLLTGGMVLGSEYGYLKRIDFQVGDRGWRIDDLLLTLESSSGVRYAALSVKSNRQVTSGGFPPDFTRAVWEHWQGGTNDPFGRDRDLLCLAVGLISQEVEEAWDLMLKESVQGDPERVATRLTSGQSSKPQKKLFESLQCPSDLAGSGSADTVAAAHLLRHLRLFQFDYEKTPSSDEREAVVLCQTALERQDGNTAVRLWHRLQEIASDNRVAGGYVDLQKMLSLLRHEFLLREYPVYDSDWRMLEKISIEAMGDIRTEIASGIHLDRKEFIGNVAERLGAERAVILVGESGWGKSGIAKLLLQDTEIYGRVVWFTDHLLDHPGQHSIERDLGLTHALQDILQSVASRRAILVLDGLDRFSERSLRAGAQLIKGLLASSEKSTWAILATSQPQGWERAARVFVDYGILFGRDATMPVSPPSVQEIQQALMASEPLKLLAFRADLKDIFSSLKVLDFVARAATAKVPAGSEAWAGIADVIDWVWQYWKTPGAERHARAGLLQKLGIIEAETLSSGVPESCLSIPEAEFLGQLENDQLVKVRDGRVAFSHDMVGDWARYMSLVVDPSVNRIKEISLQPRWHAAVRLYGQRLLERGGEECAEWRSLVLGLRGLGHEGDLGADLLLDSIIFAAFPKLHLEKLWPDLSSDNGVLLSRLLKRFLYIATIPDPRIRYLSPDQDMSHWLTANIRIPLWYLWGPMLSFLRSRIHEVVQLIPGTLAKICTLWLKSVPQTRPSGDQYPWRQEAAELALALAREVQAWKEEGVIVRELDEYAYEAVLQAAPDLPDDVSTLVLELCCRRDLSPQIRDRVDEHRRKRHEEHVAKLLSDPEYRERQERLKRMPTSVESLRSTGIQDPWPDGPRGNVDRTFRKVCMEKAALIPLLMARSQVAKEVLLALCIEGPHRRYEHDLVLFDHLGIEDWCFQPPSMYFKGPFLGFLQQMPSEGLDLIIRLVNFATERWKEGYQQWQRANGMMVGDDSVSVLVSGGEDGIRWYGNGQVYGWFRDQPHAPNTVVAALMALEKWFYDKLDAAEDVQPWINTIWERGKSAAFLGVLSEVGKKHPTLLESPLIPLLGIRQLYDWDLHLVRGHDNWTMSMTLWVSSGEMIFNLVRDWHGLPHRKQLFQQLAVQLLFEKENVRNYFRDIRMVWQTQINELNRDAIECLSARFNIDNYRTSPGPQEGSVYITFEWPEHLRAKTEAQVHHAQEQMNLISFPMRCRRFLDGESTLGAEDLDNFWKELRGIPEKEPAEDFDICPDALSGGVAVLICLHRDWLRNNPEYEKWCLDNLKGFFLSPPIPRSFDVPQAVGNRGWDCFAGEAAVMLLSENMENEDWRLGVALGVVAFHHSATGATLQAAYRRRDALSDDFLRLVNLSVMWCGLAIIRPRDRDDQAAFARWDRWRRRLVLSFVNRTLPAQMVPWGRISDFAARLTERRHDRLYGLSDSSGMKSSKRNRTRRNRPRKRREAFGLNLGILQNAFAWLPTLDQARSSEECQIFRRIYEELLSTGLAHAPLVDEEHDTPDNIPMEYDRWVFEKLARLIVRLAPTADADSFWRPILNLGPTGHHWIESFLRAWFRHGIAAAPSPEQFFKHWRRMIQFSMQAPSWRRLQGKYQYYLGKMTIEMMGLNWGASSVGAAEFVEHIHSMTDLYEIWADQWLCFEDAAAGFAAFLCRPSGVALQLKGLLWLDNAFQQPEQLYRWDHSGLESTLIDLLLNVWRGRQIEIGSDRALRTAFLHLLSILVRRQNPAALELQNVVLSSPK